MGWRAGLWVSSVRQTLGIAIRSTPNSFNSPSSSVPREVPYSDFDHSGVSGVRGEESSGFEAESQLEERDSQTPNYERWRAHTRRIAIIQLVLSFMYFFLLIGIDQHFPTLEPMLILLIFTALCTLLFAVIGIFTSSTTPTQPFSCFPTLISSSHATQIRSISSSFYPYSQLHPLHLVIFLLSLFYSIFVFNFGWLIGYNNQNNDYDPSSNPSGSGDGDGSGSADQVEEGVGGAGERATCVILLLCSITGIVTQIMAFLIVRKWRSEGANEWTDQQLDRRDEFYDDENDEEREERGWRNWRQASAAASSSSDPPLQSHADVLSKPPPPPSSAGQAANVLDML